MHPNLVQELAALTRMTVGQLRIKFADVLGEETRSGNKAWSLATFFVVVPPG